MSSLFFSYSHKDEALRDRLLEEGEDFVRPVCHCGKQILEHRLLLGWYVAEPGDVGRLRRWPGLVIPDRQESLFDGMRLAELRESLEPLA